MKTESKNRFGYSEKKMADAFSEMLLTKSNLPFCGSFDGIYREVSCQQGRPDFIALRNNNECKMKPIHEVTGFVSASILSMLKPRAPRTINYLIHKSQFSADSIKRTVRKLSTSGYIEKTKTGSYKLCEAFCFFSMELWAFELKLDNPKRAIFQAQQSKAYAECSIVVVPPGQGKNYQRYKETMKRWGIGLATFDPLAMIISIIMPPRKSKAFSRQHQIYTIMQLHSSEHM